MYIMMCLYQLWALNYGFRFFENFLGRAVLVAGLTDEIQAYAGDLVTFFWGGKETGFETKMCETPSKCGNEYRP